MGRQGNRIIQRVGKSAAGYGVKSYLVLRRFWRETAGVTSVEYAMLLVCIMSVALSAVQILGRNVEVSFVFNLARMRAAGFGK